MALIDKLFDWEITAMTGFFHTVHSACNIIPTAFTPFMDRSAHFHVDYTFVMVSIWLEMLSERF